MSLTRSIIKCCSQLVAVTRSDEYVFSANFHHTYRIMPGQNERISNVNHEEITVHFQQRLSQTLQSLEKGSRKQHAFIVLKAEPST